MQQLRVDRKSQFRTTKGAKRSFSCVLQVALICLNTASQSSDLSSLFLGGFSADKIFDIVKDFACFAPPAAVYGFWFSGITIIPIIVIMIALGNTFFFFALTAAIFDQKDDYVFMSVFTYKLSTVQFYMLTNNIQCKRRSVW